MECNSFAKCEWARNILRIAIGSIEHWQLFTFQNYEPFAKLHSYFRDTWVSWTRKCVLCLSARYPMICGLALAMRQKWKSRCSLTEIRHVIGKLLWESWENWSFFISQRIHLNEYCPDDGGSKAPVLIVSDGGNLHRDVQWREANHLVRWDGQGAQESFETKS